MADQKKADERRKYERVPIESTSKSLEIDVEGHGPALIYDMSYSGAALSQPRIKRVQEVDQIISLVLKTSVDQATIPARVVRANNDVLAVEFKNINVNARVIIDRMVTDRIVGLNMELIDNRHYSVKSDFSFWFHGPKETNLYLWALGSELVKAQLDMGTALLVFENDSFLSENKKTAGVSTSLNNQQIVLKALSIVAAMDHDIKALKDF
ncbi:MAG: PilZ domain-containing protein, partial [Pseudomonadota bacterium]